MKKLISLSYESFDDAKVLRKTTDSWKFRKLFLSLQPEYYCQTLKNNDYEKKKGKFQC